LKSENDLVNIKKWMLVCVFSFIFAMISYMLVSYIQKAIFVPKDYFMWLFNKPGNRLIFILQIYFIVFIGVKYIFSNFSKKLNEIIKKHKFLFLLTNIILIYAIIVNVSVIQKYKIITYSFLKPTGNTYTLEDIDYVETGVHGKEISLSKSKNEFYYIVNFKDKSSINLNDTLGSIDGTKEEMDTYLEIEIFDKYIEKNKINKIASDENIGVIDYDKTYVDRFKRIIN
jgi:hypothetical protein